MHLKPNTPSVAAVGRTLIGFNIVNGREIEGDLGLIESRSAVDNRDVVGLFPDSGAKDFERAAKAAAEAFPDWSRRPGAERGAVIRRIGDILAAQGPRLARIITREIGLPAREALAEVQGAVEACAYAAGEGLRLHGRTFGSALPRRDLATYRRPLGVCGVLASGISPLATPAWRILPAILAGNAVVWKPSEHAPSTAYLLMQALRDAGLPPGVVNTVNGRGRSGCGKHFLAGLEKGLYQGFSFSGSAALGRTVGEVCGRSLVPASLDLGGKNPLVVMEDADLQKAAKDAVAAAFTAAGQSRAALGNLILHRPIAEHFTEMLLEAVSALPMGNPVSHPEVAFGPMLCARHADAFREHWEAGRRSGARLLLGGAQWNADNRTELVRGEIDRGIYMQPCVWEGVTREMALFQQEVVGPNLNLATVDSFEEALALANGSAWGPVSGLYTENRRWVETFKLEARARATRINGGEGHGSGLGWDGGGVLDGSFDPLDACTRWHGVAEESAGAGLEPAAADLPKPSDWDALD